MKYFIYCRKSEEAEDRQIMSLDSQSEEIESKFSDASDITIVDRFEEAFSAKAPGRPVFNEMLDRIEKGEADGIIAWHPDRLARNSVDGGRIVYLLDRGVLKDMRFCTYTFENTPQGKFMLNIIFSYSKYYVDSLSENVKRGQRTKLRCGWQPNLAPIGYRNRKDPNIIVPDGEHFRDVRRMFDLLLSGRYSVSEIHRIVCDGWGYLTPILKTRGGTKIARSTLYRIFENPFYAGYIRWNGELHAGNHKPVITKAEFENAQRILRGHQQPRPKRLSFRYGGLFTCGACGLSVTVERKRKPSGRTYIRYHCTRVHRTPKCTEQSVEEREIAQQVSGFLNRIHLPETVLEWFIKEVRASLSTLATDETKVTRKLEQQVQSKERELSNLTDLRVRDILTDAEFSKKREALRVELDAAKENVTKAEERHSAFEPLKILQILRCRANIWFEIVDDPRKRALLKILSSNPTIKDNKALLLAKKPFVQLDELLGLSHLRGDVDDVRTLVDRCGNDSEFNGKLKELAADLEVIELAKEARALIEQIDPSALAELNDLP